LKNYFLFFYVISEYTHFCKTQYTIRILTTMQRQLYKQIMEKFSCGGSSPYPLAEEDISCALALAGESLVLELSYEDLLQDKEQGRVILKLLEALSVLVCFEDDGTQFDTIAKYIQYLHSNTQKEQNFLFGVQTVQQLSSTPVTILLSGILPINQLEIAIGTTLYEFIQNNYELLLPHFTQFRQQLSQEIGIPILPIKHYADANLQTHQIALKNGEDGTVICECKVKSENMDPTEIIDDYLRKLYFVYKKLST